MVGTVADPTLKQMGRGYWTACKPRPYDIWFNFLKRNGWKHSVDLEAYTIAEELGKKIEYLESIEDQIGVLESLGRERIVAFLKSG